MIEIVYHRRSRSIEGRGHAQYAAKGSDVVCSAVSAILYTLAEGVRPMDRGGRARFSAGHALVRAKPRPRDRAAATLLFDTAARGLLAIARRYPENVRVRVLK